MNDPISYDEITDKLNDLLWRNNMKNKPIRKILSFKLLDSPYGKMNIAKVIIDEEFYQTAMLEILKERNPKEE